GQMLIRLDDDEEKLAVRLAEVRIRDAQQLLRRYERAVRGGGWEIFTHGGRQPTGIDAVAWCGEMQARGAGEILLTSMDRDGTGSGFDIALLQAVARAVTIPIVASGGVGTLDHFAEGARAGATGLLAASVFHFGQFTISEVKASLHRAGLPVRLTAS
uniref:HisA/HisF-related TIM barrel protein n=1 Tax=Acidiphilium sp. TaxID=527 RepID=UPI0025869012